MNLMRFSLALVALIGAGSLHAEASLFIYPTLVMFERNVSSAEVTISNRGDEAGTFEIDWAHMSMTEEGGLVSHSEPVSWAVQPFVRYSPRRVTLAPSESQVIKIALRRDGSTAEGEYYSHMRVITINSEAPGIGTGDESEDVPGVNITARTAIAIPVVWRNSGAEPDAEIESVSVADDGIELAVLRNGPLSVRGFVHVVDIADDGMITTFVEPMPLVIYPTADRRHVAVPFDEGVSPAALPDSAVVVLSPDEFLTANSVVYSSRRLTGDP